MAETRKKTSRKKTTAKAAPAEETKAVETPRDSDEAKAAAKKADGPKPGLAEAKRKDTVERLKSGAAPSLDQNDPALGWDAQQGALPVPEAVKPATYSPDQLPDPEKLEAAGYAPVLPERFVAKE